MSRIGLPTFSEERALLARGFSLVAGVDEAGCGAWAGPVYAGAVILPSKMGLRSPLVRDSKLLSPTQRAEVELLIKKSAHSWAVGVATAEEVDRLNVRRASALAMRRAVETLSSRPEFLLIDAFSIPGLDIPSKGIIGGDRIVKSIAAASILAKTARDRFMVELEALHPGYGFAAHKGYGTARHQAALGALGPCAEHRKSYAPIKVFAKAVSI